MAISLQDRVVKLRQSAEHCRALAQSAVPFAVVREIERFAADLEAEAVGLEQGILSASPAPRRKRRNKRSGNATIDGPQAARRSAVG